MVKPNPTRPHGRLIDLTGKRFSRLYVICRLGSDRFNKPLYECQCDCGTIKKVGAAKLKSGHTKSCGCLSNEKRKISCLKHGRCNTVEYHCWQHMKQRCRDTTLPSFKNYGGRGINVCERWLHNFSAFLEDMGPKPTKQSTIERKNNGLGYCKDNCCWAERRQQMQNTRINHYAVFNGECHCLAEWARILKMKTSCLVSRIVTYGWSIDRAFTTPPRRMTR